MSSAEPASEADVADHIKEALPEYLLNRVSDRMLVMEYERRYLKIDFADRECEGCGDAAEHRIEKDTYREIVRTECSACGHKRRVEYGSGGGAQ